MFRGDSHVIFTCGFATVRSAWRGMMSGCIWWYTMRRHASRTSKSTLLLGGRRLTPAERGAWLWLSLSLSHSKHWNASCTPASSSANCHLLFSTCALLCVYKTSNNCSRRRILYSAAKRTSVARSHLCDNQVTTSPAARAKREIPVSALKQHISTIYSKPSQ
jgi:hypothetical protein